MNPTEAIRRGLIAAVPVCLVVMAIILARANAIEGANTGPATGLGGDTAFGWIGTWIMLTLAFGVVAAAAYDYLAMRWGWNGNDYLSFALTLAIALSAVAFLRVYDGDMHPFRIEYSAFNFAYALGFGYAIPRLTGVAVRKVVARAGQAAQ